MTSFDAEEEYPDFTVGERVILTGATWFQWELGGAIVEIDEIDTSGRPCFTHTDSDGDRYLLVIYRSVSYGLNTDYWAERLAERATITEELVRPLVNVIDQKTGKPELVGNSVLVKNPCATCGHDWAAHEQPGDPTRTPATAALPKCSHDFTEEYNIGLQARRWCACAGYVQRYVLQSLAENNG